jgi:hypothetical protein
LVVLECGERNVSIPNLWLIARVLRSELSELLEEEPVQEE